MSEPILLSDGAMHGALLPPRFAHSDPIEIARGATGGVQALFQRFDLHSRRLVRSVVPLVARRLPSESWSRALRIHFAGHDGKAQWCPLLMFAGVEAIGDLGPGPSPSVLIYRLDRYIEIDHEASVARLHGAGGEALSQVIVELDARLVGARSAPQQKAASAVPGDWKCDASLEDYRERIAIIQAEIAVGRIKGVNLSLGLSRSTDADPFDIYRACAASNPSPYGFVLREGDFALVGSSPLAFMQLRHGSIHLETDAGTRPVEPDPAVNELAERDLLHNPKDAAEHQVVVDAELEALKPIARGGRIDTVVSRKVRRFSHVMHLYSAFDVALDEGLDAVDAMASLAPAAAVSGYPKRAAIEVARRVEGSGRGPYGGVVGMLHSLADADLAVVIRSLWISGGIARMRVGGKVVAGSVAESEYAEALSKSRFLVNAVAQAEAGKA